MSKQWADVVDWMQVIVGMLALAFAPGAISAIIGRLRARIVARCQAVVPLKGPVVWRVTFQNRSRHFHDVSILVFPDGRGSAVQMGRIVSPEDGGLQVRTEVVKGALSVHFERFYRERRPAISVVFSEPGIPAFHSNAGRVRRSIELEWKDLRLLAAAQLELMHHRVALLYVSFLLIGAVIIARIGWLMYVSVR